MRLLEEETRDLVLVAHRGFSPQMAQDRHRLKAGEGLPGLALQQGAPIVVEHLSQHPTQADSRLQREGYESYMAVPLQLHGQLVGTLSLFARSARGFDTYERSFFHQVGVTLENALLYEEAARREQEAAFLDHATQLFNSTLELDAILQQAGQVGRRGDAIPRPDFFRDRASAGQFAPLEDEHAAASLRQVGRRHEPVVARADDDDVKSHRFRPTW